MVVAGCIWLLMVLGGAGWLWPVLDCEGKFLLDLSILLSDSGLS